MTQKKSKILAVPTHIITGFLGVGKTSAILHLLTSKPVDERWAVLVNEFGEVGIDGSFFQGEYTEKHGVFIREVPGGCMCCAAGLPMQVALALLLDEARPDRLLIEPTGLGHPAEVLQTLSAKHYHDVLSIQKIVTLVDARKLLDSRYTEHETFNQQIAIGDVVIGNKQDLYSDEDVERLLSYVRKKGFAKAKVYFTKYAELELDWLHGATEVGLNKQHHHYHASEVEVALSDLPIPEYGFIKAQNHGEGFESIGWRFAQTKIFGRGQIYAFLSGLSVERMKAVFITEQGIYAYNLVNDILTELPLQQGSESRLEIITTNVNEDWEQAIMRCLIIE